ncbi:MAG: hypothetical protein WDA16_13605 [Candidatus Thermoplasmatota archaeon]
MPDDPRKQKYRENLLRKNCSKRVLALITTYYPFLLREKILACCRRQLAGDYRRCCRHHLCPACNSRESHGHFAAQYARFEACTPTGRSVRLGHEVYTLPPHLRPLVIDRDGFSGWKRATLATIRDHHGPHVAGIMNLHEIGDRDFTLFHPHWDVVINGYALNDGEPMLHRAPRPDFDRIRADYIRHLTRELNLAPEMVPQKVSLNIGVKGGQFAHAKGKTLHIVRYSSRWVYLPHRAWLNDAGTRGDWWYKPKESSRDVQVVQGKNAMIALLAHDAKLKNRKRRVWFGYMQNRFSKTSETAFRAGTEEGSA